MLSIKKIMILLSIVLVTPCIAQKPQLMKISGEEPFILANECKAGKSSTLKELTLVDVVCIAVQRYPTIASAISGYQGQMDMIDAAQSGYYPQINFEIQTSKSSGIRDGYANTPKLTVRQKLYDFGKQHSFVEQSKAEVERQRGYLQQEIDNVIINSSSIALEIQRLEYIEIKSKYLIQEIKKILEIAASRANSGISTHSDYIQAKSRLEAAEANLFDIQTQLQTARRKLVTYLGHNYQNSKIVTIGDKFFNRTILKYKINEQEIPNLIINQASYALAQAQLDGANAGLLPTISMVGSIEKTLHGYNPNNGKYHGNYNYVGLSVEQSISSGGENVAKIKSAQRRLNSASYNIKTARLELNDQIDSLKLNIYGIESRLKVLNDRLKSINETRILYREQYTLGSRPILDLLNSEEETFRAEENLVNANHDKWLYYLQYLVYTGNARQVFKLNSIIDKILGQKNAE